MLILKKRYGQKNGVIRSHRQELMNGKITSDTIADFEVLANELKCFHSVLVHYDVNLEYFSGEVVRDILACRLCKRMFSEFLNFIHIKGLMENTAEYLPRLLEWVWDKIVFFWADRIGEQPCSRGSKNWC